MVRTATIPSLYFSDDRPGASKPIWARNGVATVLSVVGEGEGSRPPETSATQNRGKHVIGSLDF